MDSYVVRIYRQEVDGPREFVGVVEEVGTQEKKAFTTIDELWKILKTKRMINHKDRSKR